MPVSANTVDRSHYARRAKVPVSVNTRERSLNVRTEEKGISKK